MQRQAYINSIHTAKHTLRTARNKRRIAYHLDLGYSREVEYDSPGWYRWFPYPTHRGYLVEAAALSVGPSVPPQGRPY